MVCKTFAAPRECKTFADHFDIQFDGKFRQIDAKIKQMWKRISVKLVDFCEIKLVSSLINSIAILLRDRRLGGIWFLQTRGSYFHPKGRSPEG